MSRLRSASPLLLASLLTATGAAHFAFPTPYDGIIPAFVPGPPRFWTYASGAAELVCAAAVAAPAARRTGGLATAGLLVAVFPANVVQAVHSTGAGRWVALARLPLQVPLVLWALSVRGSEPNAGDVGEPDVRAPEVRAPEVSAPEVSAPEVSAPDVRAGSRHRRG